MAMFKIAPPPLVVANLNPVVIAPPPKPIEKLVETKPVTATPPKKQPVKPPVKELVKLEIPKPILLKPPIIEAKPKPVIKEKVAIIKPTPKPPIKVKPKLKKKVKKKVKLKKKKIIKSKKIIVKNKPKVKPRKIAPSKRKAIVKKRINKKPPLARKAKAPTYRPSPRKVAPKRIVRHTNAQQRTAIKKHGRPKTQQASKPTYAIKSAVKTKPAARPTAQPRVARNPQLERQYEKSIRQRIEQKKVYPRLAKRMRKQGVVKVAFTISRNGIVSRLRIVQSSGVKSLDKAALQAVKKVGQFPSIPAGIRKSVLNYIIPIAYHIR